MQGLPLVAVAACALLSPAYSLQTNASASRLVRSFDLVARGLRLHVQCLEFADLHCLWRWNYKGQPVTVIGRMPPRGAVASLDGRVILLSEAYGLRAYSPAGRALWSRRGLTMDDPGPLVVCGSNVVYEVGVLTNWESLGYPSEATLLQEYRGLRPLTIARNLRNGRQLWARQTTSVGVPLAGLGPSRFVALFERSPFRDVSARRRRFQVRVYSARDARPLCGFELPGTVTAKAISSYQSGWRLVSHSRHRWYTRCVFQCLVKAHRDPRILVDFPDGLRYITCRFAHRTWHVLRAGRQSGRRAAPMG